LHSFHTLIRITDPLCHGDWHKIRERNLFKCNLFPCCLHTSICPSLWKSNWVVSKFTKYLLLLLWWNYLYSIFLLMRFYFYWTG
jgi:hypothetical protein